jgi:hypothetical protein
MIKFCLQVSKRKEITYPIARKSVLRMFWEQFSPGIRLSLLMGIYYCIKTSLAYIHPIFVICKCTKDIFFFFLLFF